MKKILIASVAIAAMLSPAIASADDVFHASIGAAANSMHSAGIYTLSVGGSDFIFNEVSPGGAFTGFMNAAIPGVEAAGVNANLSLITLEGHSALNNGTAETSRSETFTLEGDVTPDCSFFVGNVNKTIDFGTIGIEARENVGPASAFDMTAPATAEIQTNVAGCNTRNLVRVTKGNPNGMRNASTSGYDPAQFTNVLPYTVDVAFNGSAPNSAAAQAGAFQLTTSEQTDSQQHGAWKSVFTMDINVPTPSLSLLAGTYSDTVAVSLTVQ